MNVIRRMGMVTATALAAASLGGLAAAPAQARDQYLDACQSASSFYSYNNQNIPAQVLRRGSRGGCVQELQSDLKLLGAPGSDAPNFIDGAFGPNTDRAVRWFQSTYAIAGGADGVVGKDTWAGLFGRCYFG